MANLNLFQLMLRNTYDLLPAVVRQVHEVRLGHFEGEATITGANTGLARLVRRLGGLPPPNGKTNLVCKIIRSEFRERWLRKFGAIEQASTLTRLGKQNLLCENFGLLSFYFTLAVQEQRLYWHCVGWSMAGIPLPDGLSPDVDAWEGCDEHGRYQFHVHIRMPLVGHLLGYEGWFVPAVAE
jgi:hypothetical protein